MTLAVSVAIVLSVLIIVFVPRWKNPYLAHETASIAAKNRQDAVMLAFIFWGMYLIMNCVAVLHFIHADWDGNCFDSAEKPWKCVTHPWSSKGELVAYVLFGLACFSIPKSILMNKNSALIFNVNRWRLLFRGQLIGSIHLRNVFRKPSDEILVNELIAIVGEFERHGGGIMTIHTHIYDDKQRNELIERLSPMVHELTWQARTMPLCRVLFYRASILLITLKHWKRRKTIRKIVRKQNLKQWFKITVHIESGKYTDVPVSA